MNRELRIRQTPDRRVYFISDTHLNHDPKWKVPLWEARGFESSKAHTDGIIDKINEIVRPNDILFHLGDFCLNTDEHGFNELLARIKCQNIYILWGNHNNPVWKVYQREVKAYMAWNEDGNPPGIDGDVEIYPFRYRNLLFLGNRVEVAVDGYLFIMDHYPIYVFNYMKDGAKHLCGHSHYGLDFSKADNLNSKILDIGWDGFGKPLTLDEVLDIMDKKKVFETSDHHKKAKTPVTV